jgi:hypothetical protein
VLWAVGITTLAVLPDTGVFSRTREVRGRMHYQ